VAGWRLGVVAGALLVSLMEGAARLVPEVAALLQELASANKNVRTGARRFL